MHGSWVAGVGARERPRLCWCWILRFSHPDTALERSAVRGPVKVRGPLAPKPKSAATCVQLEYARHPPPCIGGVQHFLAAEVSRHCRHWVAHDISIVGQHLKGPSWQSNINEKVWTKQRDFVCMAITKCRQPIQLYIYIYSIHVHIYICIYI